VSDVHCGELPRSSANSDREFSTSRMVHTPLVVSMLPELDLNEVPAVCECWRVRVLAVWREGIGASESQLCGARGLERVRVSCVARGGWSE
jgi:hypothetical protein